MVADRIDKQQARDALTRGFREIGFESSPEQEDALMRYLAELKRWNRAYSLTALKTDKEIVVKHFLDSALYLRALPEDARTVADVGSGAGFPGIVMKILRPVLTVTLIEPSTKKDTFLRHVIRTLGREGISTVHARVEDAHMEMADAAVTRALFSALEFAHAAAHIVRPGGVFILSKGPKAQDEVLEARGAGYKVEVSGAILPSGVGERTLLKVTR